MKIQSDLVVDGVVTADDPSLNGHLATKGYVDSLIPPSELPVGGTAGQILIKDSAVDGDVSWANVQPVLTNTQSGTSYELVLADAGKFIELQNAASITLTVPTNASVAFPVGTRIDLLQTGAGQVTVSPNGGVTLNYKTGAKLSGQWAAATLIKRATDTWVLIGSLST